MSNDNSNSNLIPSLTMDVTQTMSHPNAFGGQPVTISFGTGTNGWSSVTGTEIERWGQGYVDLLARNGSTGLKYTFSSPLPPGMYYLKWVARGRWDEDASGNPAENEYYVQILSGENFIDTIAASEAPVLDDSEAPQKCAAVIGLESEETITIEFIPTGSGTRGPLIGINISLEKLELEVVQKNYPLSVTERNTDLGDRSGERTIEEEDVAWITGAPLPPDLCFTLKCSSLVSWRLNIEVRSERTERGSLDNLDESYNLENDSFRFYNASRIIGGHYVVRANFIETEEGIEIPEISRSFYVRGTNPLDNFVTNYINSIMGNSFDYAWAIATHESLQDGARYNQFNTIPGSFFGKPNFGAPDGWGIAQLDGNGLGRTITTAEVYNWKANIDGMRVVLIDKKATFERIKAIATRDISVNFPDVYFYDGYEVPSEMLSILVYYNGAIGTDSSPMPEYSGNKFPWKIVDNEWRFVDNKNYYAQKIVRVLFSTISYVQ